MDAGEQNMRFRVSIVSFAHPKPSRVPGWAAELFRRKACLAGITGEVP